MPHWRFRGPSGVCSNSLLKLHKDAIAEIKSAQQRVKKATEEHDKLKAKLKKAQLRLAMEQYCLRKSQDKLES